MRYVGGKGRLAARIAEVVRRSAGERGIYLEPFVGGGPTWAATAPLFKEAHGGDACEDIALMWQAVRDGWLPEGGVTDEVYQRVLAGPPSALRGFVGFGCSFGGKWAGGRARGGFNAGGVPRDHSAESARRVAKLAPAVRALPRVEHRDYRSWPVTADWVVYCDPPYAGTQAYAGAPAFDSAEFWVTVTGWARSGAAVVVSEYQAPAGWVQVAEFGHVRSLQHGRDGRHATVERLFVWGGSSTTESEG